MILFVIIEKDNEGAQLRIHVIRKYPSKFYKRRIVKGYRGIKRYRHFVCEK